ncbi:MAG TPA: hypothetical protein VIK78_14505 [Ruminiclostridium sp.]
MQDLQIEMSQTRKTLNECLLFYKNNGIKKAESEMKYNIARRIEFLRLHVEDKVAWTACNDLAKGEPNVAKLRFERDLRKSDYECCLEKILQLKVELRIIENEMMAERKGM